MFTDDDDDLDFYDDYDISDLIVDPDKPWETPGYEWEYDLDDLPEPTPEQIEDFHKRIAEVKKRSDERRLNWQSAKIQ